MAAHDDANPLLRLKEQITCSICLEVYEQPKSLTCQHAFCVECIDRLPVDIVNGEYKIKCPACRKLTVLPGDGSTNNLPSAFHINALLELYNAPPTRQDSEESREATRYEKCPKHRQRYMEMFCEDCDEFICLECSIREHRNHEYDLANAMYPKFQKYVNDHLIKLNERATVVTKVHEVLTSRENEITERGGIVKNKIDSYIQNIVELLQNYGNMLKENVDTLVVQETKSISNRRNEVKETLDQLQDCKECVERELHGGTQHQLLEKKTELIEKMTTITQQAVSMDSPNRIGLLFLPNDNLVEACSNIGTISSVTLPMAQAGGTNTARCSGKGSVVALVGKRTHFYLHLPAKPDSLSSCCLYNEDCGPLTECRLEDNDNRKSRKDNPNQPTYTVYYTPTRIGLHHIKLEVGGVAIPCDPCTIRVHEVPSPETRTKRIMGGAKVNGPWGIGITSGDLLVISEPGSKFEGDDPCVTVRDKNGDVLSRMGEDWLYDPTGVAITPDQHVLVADAGNHRVLKFTLDGALVAEGNKRLQILFSYPYDLTVDPRGLVYVSDSRHHCIHVLYPDLSFSHMIGKKGRGPGQFEQPRGVTVDSQGVLYVCDNDNFRIQKFSPDGEYIGEFGQDVLLSPFYVTIDTCDIVYVTDSKSRQVLMFDSSSGECLGALGDKEKMVPHGIAVGLTGDVYVCDYDSSQVIVT